MNKPRKTILLLLTALFMATSPTHADPAEEAVPDEYVYAMRGAAELKLFVFPPENNPKTPTSAMLIFHGGGWSIGEASWSFPAAKRYAKFGITTIAVQYRLSDQKSVTPLEAMSDAREAVRWVRKNAEMLSIDPDRIVVFGWSAGAHLGVCTALFDQADSAASVSCLPDALILSSPALSLVGDPWPQRLLLNREDVRNISPAEHVREGLPPTLILQGDHDTVTPLAGSERFHRRMVEKGNRCELKIYEGYGHLFTPDSLPDDGWPQPDPKIQEDAMQTVLAFLRSLEFID